MSELRNSAQATKVVRFAEEQRQAEAAQQHAFLQHAQKPPEAERLPSRREYELLEEHSEQLERQLQLVVGTGTGQ